MSFRRCTFSLSCSIALHHRQSYSHSLSFSRTRIYTHSRTLVHAPFCPFQARIAVNVKYHACHWKVGRQSKSPITSLSDEQLVVTQFEIRQNFWHPGGRRNKDFYLTVPVTRRSRSSIPFASRSSRQEHVPAHVNILLSILSLPPSRSFAHDFYLFTKRQLNVTPSRILSRFFAVQHADCPECNARLVAPFKIAYILVVFERSSAIHVAFLSLFPESNR